MTAQRLFSWARQTLSQSGVDSPDFDAKELCAHFLGLSREELILKKEFIPPKAAQEAFQATVAQRAEGRPLQYILGEWEFMGLSLFVGEGVLIPREDTAVLVEELHARLGEQKAPRGLDLCAGTGAVALGLCSRRPDATVLCLELSERAFSYLKKNLSAYPEYQIASRQEDVLLPPQNFEEGSLDFLASNPPYIAKDELPTLQREVQREPQMALDGGEDGLVFYRAIASLWLPLLRPGGVFAVEVGETQADEVSALFSQAGAKNLSVKKDWADLPRVVSGEWPGK